MFGKAGNECPDSPGDISSNGSENANVEDIDEINGNENEH